jgi:hypothetical protein
MWKDYINTVAKGYDFKQPVIQSEIQQIKKELQVELPNDLFELYKETNGVFDEFGCPLIWSTDQVIRDNLFFRSFADYKDIYMPFDHLLFFSDAGNGDLFGNRKIF